MPPIVLLGRGPLPVREHRHHNAAGLRTWQFARALAADGLQTELLLLEADAVAGTAETDGLRVTTLSSTAAGDASELRSALDRLAPEALVGATAYASYLLARSGHPAPLWVDLHGDPAVEGQALAWVRNDDRCLADYLWMLHWCLRRGDRFSVVSDRQRLVAIGQLGAIGRLNRHTAMLDWVASLPDAIAFTPEPAEPAPEGDFQVVLSGSFNSWIDGETLVAAMASVLAERAHVRFAITGGAVAGFLEEPWNRFAGQIAELPGDWRARVTLHGWVEQKELDRIESRSACGLVCERQLLEREIGSQNRSLRWMARGLPVVTTAQSELGNAIAREGLGVVYRPHDAADLARSLIALAEEPARARELGRRARDWIARHRSIAATTAPLVAWARRPEAAPDRSRDASEADLDRALEPLAVHPALSWVREAGHRRST